MTITDLISQLTEVRTLYGDLDVEIPGSCVQPETGSYIPERIENLHVYAPGGVVYLESQTRIDVD